jgi:hypothetical protein
MEERKEKVAKLLLEYLRALIWPAVALSFLIGFSPELRDLSKRVAKVGAGGVSAEFATGQADRGVAQAGAPDVWFEIQERPGDCMNRALTALRHSSFSHIIQGEVTYGYKGNFVGAVWCGGRDGSVLITVAGPQNGLAATHSGLAKAFSDAKP